MTATVRSAGVPPAFHLRRRQAFTLFEVVLALGIMMLLSGAIFLITTSALEATKITREEQRLSQRLDAFLRVTRDTFLGLEAKGRVYLRFEKTSLTAPMVELVLEQTAGAFGVASLGGGSLVLAALPQADGSRTFALRLLPKNDGTGRPQDDIPWTPLFPGVERVKWSFFANGDWTDEWEPAQGRPELARLTFECRELAGPPVEAIFWIPPLSPVSSQVPVENPPDPEARP